MRQSLTERMQEQLDGMLSEEEVSELLEQLDVDEDAAREYEGLQQVDELLSRSMHRRAPERLAVTIMARLSQTIQTQAKLQTLPAETQQALMLSLGLVVMAMMPSMVAASWMVLNSRKNPEVLTAIMLQTIALLKMIIDALVYLLEEIEQYIRTDSEMAHAAMALLPLVLMAMIDYMEDNYHDTMRELEIDN